MTPQQQGKIDRLERELAQAYAEAGVPALSAEHPKLPEWWVNGRYGYQTIFNAIAAATRIEGSAIGISVAAFEQAMIAAAPQPAPSAEPVSSFPDRDTSKPAEGQGLFHKFEVRRVDGSDQPGGKHHGCSYFVLDMDHDQHAPAALRAYAESCRTTHPQLSADLAAKFGAAPQPDSGRVEALERDLDAVSANLVISTKRVAELEAECARLRKDAERYRWLRVQPDRTKDGSIDVVVWDEYESGKPLRTDALDAAIEAAISEKGKAK